MNKNRIAKFLDPCETEDSRDDEFSALGLSVNWDSDRSAQCYLTANIDGEGRVFTTSRRKFEELAKSWNECNFGRSIIDYHDLALIQIIGMGAEAVPFLLERLSFGEVEWIYALKGITGYDAESPDMVGDVDRIIGAWIEWGKNNGNPSRQTC